MKNKLTLIGIIALVALMGFSLIGCGDKSGIEKAGIDGEWKMDDSPNYVIQFLEDGFKVDGTKWPTVDKVEIDGSKVIFKMLDIKVCETTFEVSGDKLTLKDGTLVLIPFNGKYTKK